MTNRILSRKNLTIGFSILLAMTLFYSFLPKPVLVDIGTVKQGTMQVTIDEEAKTRVHDAFVVSAPFTSRLLRVEIEPGDDIVQGKSIIARLVPVYPQMLDNRERAKAITRVASAQSSVNATASILEQAKINKAYYLGEFERAMKQQQSGTISQSDFELSKRNTQSSDAIFIQSKADLAKQQAELLNAQASLVSIENINDMNNNIFEIKAPINGKVLRILQKSETTIQSGSPILELGDIESDLEIVAELLSTDAVKVNSGDEVIIKNWGGEDKLSGIVNRIEPFAFTKYSALGVEEQRTRVIIHFTKPLNKKQWLGHGYRVEVDIVVWKNPQATIIPSSALFRKNEQWHTFVFVEGKALLRKIDVEFNNGQQASILQGINTNEQVILYPPAELTDGQNVKQR